MKDTFNFKKTNILRVIGETISGILFDFDANTSIPAVCNIADLNLTTIELSVTRKGRAKVVIFNGKLDDLLYALYGQTFKYENCIKKLASGYKMLINLGGVLVLGPQDEFTVTMNPSQDSFTSLVLANSSVNVETVSVIGSQTKLLKIESIGIGVGKDTIDENLGSNLISVMLAADYTATYDLSAKAKLVDMTMTSQGGNIKEASENLVIAENMEMIEANPQTDVKQLVLHRAKNVSQILNNVRLKANLTKAVDADARLLIVRSQFV